jgi:DMSO/TMAO reductase YedYZ molybdopterin-dependent catalytic subunit
MCISSFPMNAKPLLIAAAAAVIVIAVAVMLPGIPAVQPGGREGGATPLAAAEVQSYEGKDLSSVADFRENSILGPQQINESDYRLTITGLTNKTLVYSYRDVLERYPHYSKVVTLHCVEGWDVTILWEGVMVRDLLSGSGPDPRANTVIFTAHDGYTTSFPLEYLMNRDIIMAYRMNNITLPAERGWPFQLVAEDKWGYKWIKWIEKIELSDDPGYRGYWEQRGYSNTADKGRSFFSE